MRFLFASAFPWEGAEPTVSTRVRPWKCYYFTITDAESQCAREVLWMSCPRLLLLQWLWINLSNLFPGSVSFLRLQHNAELDTLHEDNIVCLFNFLGCVLHVKFLCCTVLFFFSCEKRHFLLPYSVRVGEWQYGWFDLNLEQVEAQWSSFQTWTPENVWRIESRLSSESLIVQWFLIDAFKTTQISPECSGDWWHSRPRRAVTHSFCTSVGPYQQKLCQCVLHCYYGSILFVCMFFFLPFLSLSRVRNLINTPTSLQWVLISCSVLTRAHLDIQLAGDTAHKDRLSLGHLLSQTRPFWRMQEIILSSVRLKVASFSLFSGRPSVLVLMTGYRSKSKPQGTYGGTPINPSCWP